LFNRRENKKTKYSEIEERKIKSALMLTVQTMFGQSLKEYIGTRLLLDVWINVAPVVVSVT
jgi:hypothetical protein